MQVFLLLNGSPSGEIQVVIDVHIIQHDGTSNLGVVHMCE
jgi:hypothetical protein